MIKKVLALSVTQQIILGLVSGNVEQKGIYLTLGVSTVETNRDRDRDRPSCRD
jgi:hypothetical protein